MKLRATPDDHRARAAAALLPALLTIAAGCTVYRPVVVAPSGPNPFDRSWDAALGAADDTGVSVYSADRTSGVIHGVKDGSDVTIRVSTQADGRVRVEFNVKGISGEDKVLADRLTAAYNRRMGR